MDPETIDAVLQSLQVTPWGWQAALPGIAFLGQPAFLEVTTRNFPDDEPPPLLDDGEDALVRLILSGLPAVLSESERRYRDYHAEIPRAVALAHEPHIWLSREMMRDKGASRWTFVVGISEAEDYGTHLEFEGLDFVEVWSGD